MLTEHQLLAVCPAIRSVALGFRGIAEVDDLTQEALLHLWSRKDRFTGDDRFAVHWARRVSRRLFVDMAEKVTRERTILERVHVEPRETTRPDGLHGPETHVYLSELEAVRDKNARLHRRRGTGLVA